MNGARHVVGFYDRHPISCARILARLRTARGHLDDLRPGDLHAHDQDHYGGLAANDALAQAGGIAPGTRVADFCAGLRGPARYFAARYGALVTAIDLNPGRVRGARVPLAGRDGGAGNALRHQPACATASARQSPAGS